MEGVPRRKGIELSRTPVELKGGDWAAKVVPWIGGRIISMTHIPSGNNTPILVRQIKFALNSFMMPKNV